MMDWSQLLAPPGDYLVIAMGILLLLGLTGLIEQISEVHLVNGQTDCCFRNQEEGFNGEPAMAS